MFGIYPTPMLNELVSYPAGGQLDFKFTLARRHSESYKV